MTEQAFREAFENLDNTLQSSNVDENNFTSRVGFVAYLCGNVHADAEKIVIFFNCLLTAIRSIVSWLQREKPPIILIFERIVSYASDEGDSSRVRMPKKYASRKNGLLFRTIHPEHHIVVPHTLKKCVLYINHYSVLVGHHGGRKLIQCIRRHFCWVALAVDCCDTGRNCPEWAR